MYWIESVDNNGQFHSTLVLPTENYFGVGERLTFEENHQIYKVIDQKGRDHSRFLFHHLMEIEQGLL